MELVELVVIVELLVALYLDQNLLVVVEQVEQVGASDERVGQRSDDGGRVGILVIFVILLNPIELFQESSMAERYVDDIGASPLFVGRGDVTTFDFVAHVLRPVEVRDHHPNLVG